MIIVDEQRAQDDDDDDDQDGQKEAKLSIEPFPASAPTIFGAALSRGRQPAC